MSPAGWRKFHVKRGALGRENVAEQGFLRNHEAISLLENTGKHMQ
jgi:hypothetical protein